MKIELPFLPVSTNKAYYTDWKTKTRHKTSEYRKFIKDVEPFIRGYVDAEEYEIEYNFYYSLYYKNGNRRKIDKNNFEKTMSDTLVHYGVITDDSRIRRTIIESYDGEPYTAILIKDYNNKD
jgi:Holliday junction resolvase RusA-like endonuclease